MKHSAMNLIKPLSFIIFAFSVYLLSGCAKAGIGGPSYTLDGIVDGAQVVPSSSSSAIGIIVGTFDGSKNTMTGVLKWVGLSGSPTAIHIHGANPGRNGIPLFVEINIPKGTTDSLNFRSVLTESQETSVGTGGFYFDIHTAAYPQGEIRGQIIAH